MELGFTGLQSLFLSLSAMGNVGLINLPSDLWFSIPDASKLILAFLMWAGRLEIFPVLMLLTGFFKMKK